MIELLNERQINALGGIRSAKNEKADIAHHTAQELYLCIPVVSLFSLRNHSALCEKNNENTIEYKSQISGYVYFCSFYIGKLGRESPALICLQHPEIGGIFSYSSKTSK